jgi:hypothetical protein
MKIASPYLGIMAFFVVFLLVLEHAGYINLDAGEVGAAKPPEDGAAD